MKKRTRIILASAAALIVLLAALAVINRIGAERKKVKMGASDSAVFTVETAMNRRGDITDYIKINGDVKAARSIDIYPDAAGKLRKLHIAIGDHVNTNQVIAEIDPSKPGLSYALSPVRSTITGTVTSIPYEAGATVSATTPVATIGDLSFLQVEAEIAEPDIGKIGMGTKGELTFVAWPGKTYNAHVVEISPVVNTTTRTMIIKLEFDKNYPEIKAGMFASAKLFTETKLNVILVNSDAVVIREGSQYVFTASGNKAVMNRVETGLTVDGITEIISGIPSGAEVVIKGQNLLDDGVDINVIGNGLSGVKGGN